MLAARSTLSLRRKPHDAVLDTVVDHLEKWPARLGRSADTCSEVPPLLSRPECARCRPRREPTWQRSIEIVDHRLLASIIRQYPVSIPKLRRWFRNRRSESSGSEVFGPADVVDVIRVAASMRMSFFLAGSQYRPTFIDGGRGYISQITVAAYAWRQLSLAADGTVVLQSSPRFR